MNKIYLNCKNYFLGVIAEAKKVVWPTRSQVSSQTATVIIAIIIAALVFGIVDFGFSQLIQVLLEWRRNV